ncbi:hypothetical protein ACWGQ5_57135 [Streptomyces sp. NPDC055722]|jgi:hypothetical protein
MKKLIRRVTTSGVCAVVVTGGLFAADGSATAATSHTTGRTPARTVADDTVRCSHRTACQGIDPWVADQLAMFDPAAAKRLAVYDPWVKDQLALFTPAAR